MTRRSSAQQYFAVSPGDSANESTPLQKATALELDHLVALANLRIECAAVQYFDESARIANNTFVRQFPRRVSVTPVRRTPGMFAIRS